MSNDSVAVKQLQTLQKKLDNAIQSRAVVEEDLKYQSSLLLQFISKLSLVCKGMNTELDNKLATLRSNLTKSASFNDIERQLNAISQLLKQHNQKNEATVRVLHQQFTLAGKGLQKASGLPDKVRRELRSLLNSNQHSKDSQMEYLPLLTELLLIYDSAVKNNANIADNALLDVNLDELAANMALDAEFLTKVEKILNHLKLSERHQTKLSDLKVEISQSKTFDDLQGNLLEVFQIIAADLKQERDTAKNFLSSLSKTLKTAQFAVKSSLQSSAKNKEQHDDFNDQLQQQFAEMSATVESADSLTEVKNDINDKLQQITQILEQKMAHESNAQAELETQLNQMSSKIKSLEQESKQFEARLHEQLVKSSQDGLTKLNNRAAFDEHFAKEMVRYQNKPFDLALVVLDLDDFKRINDTYGHTAGDKTLQVIAGTMKKQLNEQAFIARYGGEEFVLIFSGVDQDTLTTTLNTLKTKIARLPFKFKNNKVSITVSIGATHINNNDNVHLAFERADEALYQAKKEGKNTVVYA